MGVDVRTSGAETVDAERSTAERKGDVPAEVGALTMDSGRGSSLSASLMGSMILST